MSWSFYIGQCPKNNPKNFRKLNLSELDTKEYIQNLKFSNFEFLNSGNIIDDLEQARTALNQSKINGKNENEPFCRAISPIIDDYSRIDSINKLVNSDILEADNLDHVSFVMLQYEKSNIKYRFFIKMIRSQSINSNYSLKIRKASKKASIKSHRNEARKSLSTLICYAEKIGNTDYFQYVFNVDDYEKIFGINNIKSEICREKLSELQKNNILFNGYKVIFDQQLTEEKIVDFLKKHRRCTNALYRYNGEAKNYDIKNVREALKYAEEFGQEAFEINDQDKIITLESLDSLEALISIITNKKKLAIVSNDIEDGIATKKKNKSENNLISLMDNLNIKEGSDNG